MSLYSTWLTLKQKQHLFWAAAAGIALFVAGWHTGRVMSPYYASQPIVFQESDSSPATAIDDMPQQLAVLQDESQQLRAAATAQPQVAAAQTVQPPSEALPTVVPTTTQGQRTFVASINSDLYHHISCPSVKQIKEENKVWFTTSEEAEKAGYSPSKCTQETLNK